MNKISIIIFCLLTSFILSDDEDPCNLITINENFFNDEIIGFYLSSINIESGESNTLLFDYSIDLSNAISNKQCNSFGPCPFDDCGDDYYNNLSPEPTTTHGVNILYLDFAISMYIPDFMDTTEELVDGSVRFDLNSSSIQQINFRNTDLNFDTKYLAGNTSFSLENYNLHISDTILEDIADLFLSQGKAPNGVYSFNFKLKDENGNEIDRISKVIEVFVPSFLDLVSPGSSNISDSTSNVIMSTNPIFQWNSDYCNKCDFNIRVSEFNPHTHSSLEEAIDDYSILPLGDGFYNISGITNSFQYPTSGVGEIYPGKLYVWQVMRSYDTSNGLNEEYSPLHLFKMQSLDIAESSIITTDINFENIKLLIGEATYETLFGNNGPFNDYNNVGQSLTIDGQTFSINYLIDLINKQNSGDITIIQVDVE
tara:strand:+ start:52 stop:1326 length:1275 start_codon:yes stop_codon:yes gene_type:complete